ncbi:MAG: hypothetical protein QXP72_05035 [Desulfurococcaceae archaeon]
MKKEIHHYMIEVDSSDKKLVESIREGLGKLGCIEKYSGDTGVYYAQFFTCRNTMVIIGFSEAYFIDIFSEKTDIEPYIKILTDVFGKDKLIVHYIIRSI